MDQRFTTSFTWKKIQVLFITLPHVLKMKSMMYVCLGIIYLDVTLVGKNLCKISVWRHKSLQFLRLTKKQQMENKAMEGTCRQPRHQKFQYVAKSRCFMVVSQRFVLCPVAIAPCPQSSHSSSERGFSQVLSLILLYLYIIYKYIYWRKNFSSTLLSSEPN